MIPFFSLSKEDRRLITDKITGLEKLTLIRSNLSDRKSEVRKTLSLEQARVDFLEQQNKEAKALIEKNASQREQWEKDQRLKIEQWEKDQRLKIEQWEEEEERRARKWEQQTIQTISSLEQELRQLESIDLEEERQSLNQRNALRKSLEETRENRKSVEFDLRSISQHISTKKTLLESILQGLSNISDSIIEAKSGKCPTCGQAIHDKELIQKLEAQKSDLKKQVNDCKAIIEECEIAKKKLEETIEEHEDRIRVIEGEISNIQCVFDSESEIDRISSRIAKIQAEITSMESKSYIRQKNPYVDEQNPYINEENPYVSVELPEIREIDRTRIDELEKEKQIIEYLLKFLDVKGKAKKTLVSKLIPFINQRIQVYLDLLESDYQLKFDESFEANIQRISPRHSIVYGSLSMGERQRLNLAVSLAFRDVVIKSAGMKFNILIMDEILDSSLDSQGIEDCIKIIREFSKSMAVYVISHRQEITDSFDGVITIQRNGRFSEIIDGCVE